MKLVLVATRFGSMTTLEVLRRFIFFAMFHGAVGRAEVAVAFFEGTPQKSFADHGSALHRSP